MLLARCCLYIFTCVWFAPALAQIDQSSLLLLQKTGQESGEPSADHKEPSNHINKFYESETYQSKKNFKAYSRNQNTNNKVENKETESSATEETQAHEKIKSVKHKLTIDKNLEQMVYPERLHGVAADEPPAAVIEKKVKRKTANTDKTDTNAENKNIAADTDDKNELAEDSKDDDFSQINFSTDFLNLISGKEATQIDTYKQKIHPDDSRLNRIEVGIATGIVSNRSKSNYYYRDYSTFSPALQVDGKFWLSPFFGMGGSYLTSVGAAVDGNQESKISAHHEWEEITVNLRKYFGIFRKSPSVLFGLVYSEYKLSVPSDDTSRIQTKSAGLGLHLSARLPLTKIYAHNVGIQVIPRVQNTELSTGISASSGNDPTSMKFTVDTGGEIKFKRQSQMTWKLSYSLENNKFDGQADKLDPKTNIKPQGVSVENSFVLFSIGYLWGQ